MTGTRLNPAWWNCHRTGLACPTPRRCDSSRRCLRPPDPVDAAPVSREAPRFPGFYWAKWRLCEDGTVDEAEFRPSKKWEVVEVFVNDPGTGGLKITEGGELMAFVPGVEKSQSLENFFWGPGPLDAPR